MKKINIILLLLILPITLFGHTNDELKRLMMLNNNDLAKASYDIELAQVDVDDAKAGFYPKVELLATGTYMVNPPVGKVVIDANSIIQANTGMTGIGPGHVTLYKGMENTLFDFSLNFTQPLFTWGKLKKGVEVYKKVALVKEIQKSILVNKLIIELETRQSAIYYLTKLQDNLKKKKLISNRLVAISKNAYNNGLIIKQKYLETKIKAKKIDMGLRKVKKEIHSQLVALRKLVGKNDIEIEYVPDESKYSSLISQDWNDLFKTSISPLRNSLSLLRVLSEIREKTKEVAEASMYWKPDIALQLSVGFGGSRLPLIEKDWYRKDNYKLNATLVIKTTLWDGGKKLNELKRSDINIDQNFVDIAKAKVEILQTLDTCLTEMDLLIANIEYEELNKELAQEKIDTQNNNYNAGYGDEKDVLLEKLNKLEIEFNIIQYKLELTKNYFKAMYLIK